MIPTKKDNPKGLHQKYFIQKIEGMRKAGVNFFNEPEYVPILNPVEEDAEYFVLRLDECGSDKEHIKACRIAVNAYADAIEHHLPELAKDLKERYPAAASSPIECYVPVNLKDELPKEVGFYFANYEKETPIQTDLRNVIYFDGEMFLDDDDCETAPLYWLKKVPLPVESGAGEDYTWWTEQQSAFRWWNQIGQLKRAELRQKYCSKDIIGIYNEEVPVESGWSDDDIKKAFNAASEGGYEYVSYDGEDSSEYLYVKKYDNADEYLQSTKNQSIK
jgi:hypothetical protein